MGVKAHLGSLIGTVADEASRVAVPIQPSEVGKRLLQTGGRRPGFYVARAAGTGRRYWSHIGEPDNPWIIWGSDLFDWKDTFDGVGVSYLLNGGDVSQWNDHSELAAHEVQATASAQPTLGVGLGPNGHDEIYIPQLALEELLGPASSLNAAVPAGSRPTMYAAARLDHAPNATEYIASYFSTTGGRTGLGSRLINLLFSQRQYDGVGGSYFVDRASILDTVYHAWENSYRATLNTFRRDGAKFTLTMDAPTTAAFNSGSACVPALTRAQTGDIGGQSGGRIIARIGVNRTPTTDEHRRFSAWMRYHTRLNWNHV